MLENRQGNAPISSPWGKPDIIERLAEGIWSVATPSHGGIFVDLPQYEQMSELAKKCSYTGNQWFEEDCSWAVVALTFKNAFSLPQIEAAHSIAALQYPEFYADYLKNDPDLKQLREDEASEARMFARCDM